MSFGLSGKNPTEAELQDIINEVGPPSPLPSFLPSLTFRIRLRPLYIAAADVEYWLRRTPPPAGEGAPAIANSAVPDKAHRACKTLADPGRLDRAGAICDKGLAGSISAGLLSGRGCQRSHFHFATAFQHAHFNSAVCGIVPAQRRRRRLVSYAVSGA